MISNGVKKGLTIGAIGGSWVFIIIEILKMIAEAIAKGNGG